MSDVKTLVQGSTQVIRITTFKEGDAYKRLHKPSYSETYQQFFGVVTGIHDNGEQVMITAIEFDPESPESGAKTKVFGDGSDLNIFPATPSEVDVAVRQVHDALDRSIETTQARVSNLELMQQQVVDILGGTITAPEVVRGDVLEVTS